MVCEGKLACETYKVDKPINDIIIYRFIYVCLYREI